MDIEVYQVHLTADPARLRAARAMLAQEEACRFERMVSPGRERRILARASLKRLLAGRFGIRAEDITLSYGPNGKPFLEVHGTRFVGFNVAHSADLAVIVLGPSCPVGIDIERITGDTEPRALAPYLFSERELKTFDGLSDEQQRSAFFRAWTTKEAFVKATGEGLSRQLATFEVCCDKEQEPRLLTVPPEWAAIAWTMKELPVVPGYCGTVAIGSREATVHRMEMGVPC